MSRRRVRPLTVCTIAAAAAVGGSVAMPGLARGDDGLAEPLATLSTVTEVAPQAVTGEALAAVTDAVAATAAETPATAVTADDAVPAEVAGAPPDTVAPESSAPEDMSDPAAEPVPAPDPGENGQNGADTTASTGDIAVDTPPSAPTDPVETAPVAPVAAPAQEHEAPAAESPPPTASEPRAPARVQANVNVSVRIGSPGDDGQVTQVNIVSGGSQPSSAGGTTAQAPARDTTTAEETGGGADGTWYWSWDCLDLGSIGAISSLGSANGSVPSSWTWIWNCADNSSQYQDGTGSPFSQINTNVSIRLGSPGNNGSVAQVNVGAGVRVSMPAPTLPRIPTLSSGPATPVPHLPAPALPVQIDTSTGISLMLPLAGSDGDITLPSPVSAAAVTAPSDALAAAISHFDTPPPATQTWPAAAALPFGAGFRGRRPPTTVPLEEGIAGDGSRAVAATASTEDPAAGQVPGAVSQPTPRAVSKDSNEQRAAPRWRPTPLPGSAPIRLSTASVAAAAGGGGSSGSGIPFLLALPFVAALLDLARRVALEHATWPTGHRRRAPDRPG